MEQVGAPCTLVPAQAPIEERCADTDYDADRVRDPVANVCAAIKRGLYELDEAAEGAGTYEYRKEPQAAGTGQREGECGEGYEVHELVAALGCGGRGFQWPEHGHTQGDRQKDCEGDVEVLAHGLVVAGALGKGKRLEGAMRCPALRPTARYTSCL